MTEARVIILRGNKMPVSEAQQRANQKWKEKNRERTNYLASRNSARSFIRTKATADDLAELEALIAEQRKSMN
ncbi:hypothetical protein AB3329_04755 [Streptococcus sp. H31]|uniref:hypothetical protein n=1 Tax=Streptococcus huangxiaojuni TaxID=3237239 RepID=UPI0034A3388F